MLVFFAYFEIQWSYAYVFLVVHALRHNPEVLKWDFEKNYSFLSEEMMSKHGFFIVL